MKKKTLIIIAVLIIAIIISFGALNASRKQTRLKMGTFVEITLNGPFWTDFNKIFDAAFSGIDQVSKLTNRYDKASIVSELNNSAGESPVQVNAELFNIIKESVSLSKNTGGAFDITVAPIMELWGFYKNNGDFPAENDIKTALLKIGYDNILLYEKKKTVFFKKKDLKLDLSAIAKGYAVDKAAGIIKTFGIHSGIVNAGGDIYCLGRKNIFQRWEIAIRDPADNSRIAGVIYLENSAVATSGGYEQFLIHNEKNIPT